MIRPVIGLTPTVREGKPFVDEHYCAAVEKAGGQWRLLPFAPGERALEGLDGLLFTGGVDVEPALYGARRSPRCGEIQPVRDRCEMRLLAWALGRDLPVLGICRGIQVLNAGLGGTLCQHLPDVTGAGHSDGCVHAAELLAGGCLRALTGEAVVPVNSFHHQAINRLAPSLRACAVSPDGLIEAVERPASRFFVGVQWHPERWEHPLSDAIFAAFVRACRADGARILPCAQPKTPEERT